jgi:UDP-N-acetylmuramoyl-L-alanyl-D-glutamate--2,6-diaminopimelate ligase
MGAAAAGLADVAILTSDNPRSEDPLAILAEMLAGVLTVPAGDRAHVIIEPDRGAAIDLAITGAGKGDVVLIAGKGHERGQYTGADVVPFDDREVAAQTLARRRAADDATMAAVDVTGAARRAAATDAAPFDDFTPFDDATPFGTEDD